MRDAIRVTTNEVEIRGKEVKTSQQGKEYIIVRVEDEAGRSHEFCDRNMARVEEYRKGRTLRLILDVELNGYKNVAIIGIVES